jgi:hypothetical protein
MPQVIRPKIMPGCPSQVVNCTLSCESDCGGLTERSRTHCSPKHTSVATTSEGGDGGEQILGSGGKKKRKRTKGPSRRAKDELRRARFLVDKACRELDSGGQWVGGGGGGAKFFVWLAPVRDEKVVECSPVRDEKLVEWWVCTREPRSRNCKRSLTDVLRVWSERWYGPYHVKPYVQSTVQQL